MSTQTLERPAKKILDVGCGTNKYEGAIGLDYNPRTGADVIHDLGDFPYPFEDDEFDLVYASHVVEHIPDVMGFVEELNRITKPGGRIKFITPHYTNPDWNADPTHRNHFNSYTFDTLDAEKRNFKFYTDIKLKTVSKYVTTANLWRTFGLELIINSDQRFPGLRFLRKFWEQYLSYLFRGKDMYFEFEVIKDKNDRQSI